MWILFCNKLSRFPYTIFHYFACRSGGEVLWWACLCVSVCLSTKISPEPHAQYLHNFFLHVVYGHGSVLWRGDEIPKGRGSFGGFLPYWQWLYSITFGAHTKTAEPIEMLWDHGMMSGLGPRNSVLRGGDDPRRERGILGGGECARQA